MPNIFGTKLQRHKLDKHHELSETINKRQYNILLLTETSFRQHTEGLYCYPGFRRVTVNRGESRVCGGVAVYASSKYNVKTLDTHTSSSTSALWTLIQVPDMLDPLICGVIYHPPGLLKHQRYHIYPKNSLLEKKKLICLNHENAS